jgi:hypothetical protein
MMDGKSDFLSTHHPSLMGMTDEKVISYPPTIHLSWVLGISVLVNSWPKEG